MSERTKKIITRYTGMTLAGFGVALWAYAGLLHNNYFLDEIVGTNYQYWQKALGAGNVLLLLVSLGALNFLSEHDDKSSPHNLIANFNERLIFLPELFICAATAAAWGAVLSQIGLGANSTLGLLAAAGLSVVAAYWLIIAAGVWKVLVAPEHGRAR